MERIEINELIEQAWRAYQTLVAAGFDGRAAKLRHAIEAAQTAQRAEKARSLECK